MLAPEADVLDGIHYPGCLRPMGETGAHVRLMVALIAALREYYRDADDVYVIGNINLYYERGNPRVFCSPDIMVTKGVPATPERRSFFTWIENAVPSVIIELASEDTHDEDLTTKRDLYERLGVREYFLFDPEGRWLPDRLMGYRMLSVAENGEQHDDPRDIEVRHAYEAMPLRGGRLASVEMGLDLAQQGDDLALFSMKTARQLLTPTEAYRQAERLLAENRDLQHQAHLAEIQAEEERHRREQAEEARRLAEEAQRLAEKAQHQERQLREEAEEARHQAEEARRQEREHREQAEEARRQAEGRAEEERQRREALEQELSRLRSLLPPG